MPLSAKEFSRVNKVILHFSNVFKIYCPQKCRYSLTTATMACPLLYSQHIENMCRVNQWEIPCGRQGRWQTIRGLYSLIGTILLFWRRQWQPTPVRLPGKSYGWGSLVGCRPWGREEWDMTEWLHFHFSISMHWKRKWHPTLVFLPGDSQGWWSLVGCRLWGHRELDTTEAT